MSRPKKKEIKFTKDSILSVMQEIYNEIVEQRNTAIRIQNKMLSIMKDAEDMQTIGPVIKEQQKIINDCVEKKLSLSKLQSSIWEKNSKEQEDFTMDDLDDDLVQSIIQRDIDKNDDVYKLNK
jgi:methionine salvage enolase-phosphatase E1